MKTNRLLLCVAASAGWRLASPPQGGGAFIPLTPRQPMTAAPYAVHAASAGNMSGAGLALPATPPVKFYRLQKR